MEVEKKNPSSRIWTSDLWMSDNVLLQSTALPTELSKEIWNKMNLWSSSFWLSVFVLENLFTLLPTWKSFYNIGLHRHGGGVAQMVERSLSMREVPGSIPGASKSFLISGFSRLSSKIKTCIVRESNPGRPRGRRAFYHWTNDALCISGFQILYYK